MWFRKMTKISTYFTTSKKLSKLNKNNIDMYIFLVRPKNCYSLKDVLVNSVIY